MKVYDKKLMNKDVIRGTAAAQGAATGTFDLQGDFTQEATGRLQIHLAGN